MNLSVPKTDGDARARGFGRRSTDRVPIDERLGWLSGAAAGGLYALQLQSGDWKHRLMLVLIGVLAGGLFAFFGMRTHRLRRVHWAGGALAASVGVAFVVVSLVGGAQQVAATAPGVTSDVAVVGDVGSEGPVPGSTTSTSVDCTIDLTGGEPVPGATCTGISIETIGEPVGRASSWYLDDGATLLASIPMSRDGRLLDLRPQGPECITENPAVQVYTADTERDWSDAAAVLVLDDAPSGAEYLLYSECANHQHGWRISVT